MAEQDPAEWRAAITDAVRSLWTEHGIDPQRVVAVNCTTQWSGTIPIDEDGEPVMRAITWMDTRGAEDATRITDGVVKVNGYGLRRILRWIQITGGGPGKTGKDSIAHILYIKRARPEIDRRTALYLEPKDYLNLWLTGRAVSTGETMMLHWVMDARNVARVDYHPQLLSWCGLERRQLPDLVATNSVIGTLNVAAAEALGLSPSVVVIAGTPDVHSTAVGSGAVREGEPHLYVGTSAWMVAHIGSKRTDVFHNMASMPSGIPGRYMIVNEQQAAGSAVKYVAESVLGVDVSGLNALAEAADAGSNGVMFLPWLCGERCPIDDPHARGGLFNLSLRSTRADIARATMEGVSLNARWMQIYVEKMMRQRVEQVRFIGGGATSTVWCQIMADVLDRPVAQVAEPLLSTARGAALLAWSAIGRRSIDDAADLIPVTHTSMPRKEYRELYAERFETFTHAYRRAAPLWKRMNAMVTR
jgi:xylulokinase